MTLTQSTLTVFRIDPKTELFLFAEEVRPDETGQYQVPGNCVRVALPDYVEGQWPQWISTVPRTNFQFGQPGTGHWQVVDDHRKTDLYLTADGTKYALNTEQTINNATVKYPGYGPLPDWLTTHERPSQFHNWDGTAWIPDQNAIDEHEATIERWWRDAEIAQVSWMRDRHRDEIEQELATTLTAQQYDELQLYIQALRDWPAHPDFPDSGHRPSMPAWLQS